MHTVTKGRFGTIWGRQLVPAGLSVPALDRNQSLLPFHFMRPALGTYCPSYFRLTSRFYAEAVFFPNFRTSPSTYACSSYLPAYSTLLLPHLLAQLLLYHRLLYYTLPSEVRSLMRSFLYTPLLCRIQHASAHYICLSPSFDAATL
jgi:hypothetical protein